MEQVAVAFQNLQTHFVAYFQLRTQARKVAGAKQRHCKARIGHPLNQHFNLPPGGLPAKQACFQYPGVIQHDNISCTDKPR